MILINSITGDLVFYSISIIFPVVFIDLFEFSGVEFSKSHHKLFGILKFLFFYKLKKNFGLFMCMHN